MTIKVTAFRWVPPFAQGYVRDLRVRWALEEAGLPYAENLIDLEDLATDAYRKVQPFAQVPAYREGEVQMFESGAIVLHIAAKSPVLAPADPAGRARVATWVFAALNTIEPHSEALIHIGDIAAEARRPALEAALFERLTALASWLGDKAYLEGEFTAGDLIMATVLRELVDSGVLARFPTLEAYKNRCEARPAFGRAMEAQMRPFRENAPA